MNEGAWKKIEEDQTHMLPTPPIGETVQWFKNGNRDQVQAATVVGIEEAGRLVLNVSAPSAFVVTIKGCFHVDWPTHKVRNNQTTHRCGSWDYLPGRNVPKAAYELHQKEIQRRIDNLTAAEAKAVLVAAAKPKPVASLEDKVDQLAASLAIVSERLSPAQAEVTEPEKKTKGKKPTEPALTEAF